MKMRLLLLCLIIAENLNAQKIRNLVINGGFEAFTNEHCVKTANYSVREYVGWFDNAIRFQGLNGQFSRTSPDAYNIDTCGADPNWSNHVPSNLAGYRYPNTGNGYIGILFQNPREFASGTLTNDLVKGKTYCIEMFVSLAERVSSFSTKNLQVITHSDSFLLSVPWIQQPGGAIAYMEAYFDTIIPITFESEFLSDTLNWVKLKTYFVATEQNRFFTIGNFKPLGQLDTAALRPKDIGTNVYTYYFVDDVAIYDCSDTIPPPEPQFDFMVKAYPNPASEGFNFEYTLPEAGKVRLHITDVFGKMVLARTELAGQKGINTLPIDVNAWAMGQYHVSVLYETNGQSAYRHLKMQVVR